MFYGRTTNLAAQLVHQTASRGGHGAGGIPGQFGRDEDENGEEFFEDENGEEFFKSPATDVPSGTFREGIFDRRRDTHAAVATCTPQSP